MNATSVLFMKFAAIYIVGCSYVFKLVTLISMSVYLQSNKAC